MQNGSFAVELRSLGLSQIYLSRSKIEKVKQWFPACGVDGLGPLPVRDFGGRGQYTLTDGHTRAYVACCAGIGSIPVYIDTDPLVTGELAQRLYLADIEWCRRFSLCSIGDLAARILSPADYERLWIRRCRRLYDLETADPGQKTAVLRKIRTKFYLYGAEKDLSVLYYEDGDGRLFRWRDGVMEPETAQMNNNDTISEL